MVFATELNTKRTENSDKVNETKREEHFCAEKKKKISKNQNQIKKNQTKCWEFVCLGKDTFIYFISRMNIPNSHSSLEFISFSLNSHPHIVSALNNRKQCYFAIASAYTFSLKLIGFSNLYSNLMVYFACIILSATQFKMTFFFLFRTLYHIVSSVVSFLVKPFPVSEPGLINILIVSITAIVFLPFFRLFHAKLSLSLFLPLFVRLYLFTVH